MDDGQDLSSEEDEVEVLQETDEWKNTESYYKPLEVTESQIQAPPEQAADEDEDSEEEFSKSRKAARDKDAKKVVKSNIKPVKKEAAPVDDSDEVKVLDTDYRPILDSWQDTLKEVKKHEIQKQKEDIITHFIELDSGLEANRKSRYLKMLEGAKQRNMEVQTAEQMAQLLDLGFSDYEKNTFLLRMCENDMDLVIEKLSVG